MKITKFQEGGAMPGGAQQEQGAAAQQQGGDVMEQIVPAMAQAVQNGDCQTLMQVCSQFLQFISAAAQQQPQPTFARRGGRLVKI
jgi:hypothetical protein